MTDTLQADIGRWRSIAGLDARTGAPVGDALLDACNEIERLRGELTQAIRSLADDGDVNDAVREAVSKERQLTEKAEAEAKRLQRVVDDLRDGLENRRLRNRNRRLEWILEYGRKQVEKLVDRMVAAEADRDRLHSQLTEAKSIVERAQAHGYDIGGVELDDLARAVGVGVGEGSV